MILGQLVDCFGLTTTETRAEGILRQKYPTALADLDHFLGMCSFNRHLVPYYTQIVAPLQKLKPPERNYWPTELEAGALV